jgi:hypothetical protein
MRGKNEEKAREVKREGKEIELTKQRKEGMG